MTTNIREFGQLADGRAVKAMTIAAGDITATLITLGAVLQDVRLAGVDRGLTLGSDNLADYEGQMRFHGSLIGPVVNRLTGATAPIAGRVHQFEANLDGRLTLHSGASGTHLKLWDLISASDTEVVLGLTLPDGEGGFPGNRVIRARFSVAAPASLRMEVTATTDAATILNFANHSYWNLDGGADWGGHQLQVMAENWLPCTPDFAPDGKIMPVADTAMDLRRLRSITPGAPELDNCFCLSNAAGKLRDVLNLQGRTGIRMVVATTETGMQVYDGRAAIRPGHGAYEGIAFEAQGWPDAPNHANFPQIEISAGEVYSQVTEWRFARG